MTRPDHLREFVLPTPATTPLDAGGFDLYVPRADNAPLVVLVHGGPMREDPGPTPRHWPVFRGYASALVQRGVAAAMFDHALLKSVDYALAATELAEVVAAARAHDGVDADHVAVWFFSGAGPLAAPLLNDRQPWLRTLALSYPVLTPFVPVDGFRPVDELTSARRLPVVLTKAGLDVPEFATGQDEFIAAARAHAVNLEVIEVPHGHHSFDVVDDTQKSRTALETALDLVRAHLA